MLNRKYTIIPVILGLIFLMLTFSDYKWSEIAMSTALLITTFLSKQKIIEENKDYGVHIYYTLMILWLILIFIRWFAN